MYLSALDPAKSAKYHVSCLLPGSPCHPGGFYPDSALSFYPQAKLCPLLGSPSGGVVGWMKTSEKQAAYCCESNLRAAAAQGQCRRLVQRCGSCGKGFQISSAARDPLQVTRFNGNEAPHSPPTPHASSARGIIISSTRVGGYACPCPSVNERSCLVGL